MNPSLAAGVLVLLWLIPGLFGHDPWKPDEAYSFGLVLHILETGDWVVPTLAGEPFLEKPPVFYVTAAAFAGLLGGVLPPHDAARLATAFYMGLTFVFVAMAARRLYGEGKAPIAVLLLAGSIGLVDRGHQLITDTAQLAGFALAVLGFATSLQRAFAGGLALGTGAGVAFLAKGLFIPGCLGVAAIALPLVSPAWRTRRYAGTLLVAAVAALPWITVWPTALHARGPELFDEWLWGLNVGSFIGEQSIAAKPSPFFYLWVLPWFALPAWPLAAWAAWQARREARLQPEMVLMLVLLAVLFVVLSVSKTGRELYAMPMLVPFCLLAAPVAAALGARAGNSLWRFAIGVPALAAGLVWLVWLSLDLGLVGSLQRFLLERQPAYSPRFSFVPFALALGYTAAAGWVLWRSRGREAGLAAAWTGAVALAWGLSMILLLRYVDTTKSYRAMFAELAGALPPAYSCLSSRGLGEPQRALLQYYARITTHREESAGRRPDCDALLVQGFRRDLPSPGAGWRQIWEGARPGDRKELYRLYRRS